MWVSKNRYQLYTEKLPESIHMLRKLLSKSLQHKGSSSLESENEKRVCWILSMALTLPPPVSYQLQHTLHFIQKENEKTLQIIILRNTDQVHVIKLHLIKNSYSLKLNSNTQKIVLLPIYLSAALRRETEDMGLQSQRC